MKATKEKIDVYQTITDAIIKAVEDGGTGKWSMPWAKLPRPINALTRKPYNGSNVPYLMAVAINKGYSSNEWATYNQWAEKGAQVRKGEKSSLGVYWKIFEDEETEEKRFFLRYFLIFNADQVDGYTPNPPVVLNHGERSQAADEFFGAIGADVRFGGDSAHYSPSGDYIRMPKFEQFESPEAYYSTMSHEFGHWSGAPSRLNRDLKARFGSEGYAFEELIAELTAAFLMGDLELVQEQRADHAQYIQHWLEVMRKDKKAIVTASSHAQKAANYLLKAGGRAKDKETEEQPVSEPIAA